MNRKLVRLITLVVTVLVTLAFTAPALADPPEVVNYHWDEDYSVLDCDGNGENEIWVHQDLHWQVRYDENIVHVNDRWFVYNELYPELYIKGSDAATSHLNNINGEWVTGVNMNFHAPGYPQLGHLSGYWTWDEEGNPVLQHGRLTEINVDVCELLTPP